MEREHGGIHLRRGLLAGGAVRRALAPWAELGMPFARAPRPFGWPGIVFRAADSQGAGSAVARLPIGTERTGRTGWL